MVEFKDYLRAGPDFDDLDLTRATEFPWDLDWAQPREPARAAAQRSS
ncbi:MAG: hypothetical protein ACR2MP_30080 [Streptosporangiaceae bacterium]